MNYDNETPMNDKFLMADGSIRNANGQIIQSANEYWKQRYKQATPIPAKFLHADGTIDENIGGGGSGTSLKYHLYAWDYSSGFCVGYTEKEVPVAGDLLFLKQDMEEGKITDPIELKMIYHVVSDVDGVITVSEHPEGASGYTFTRNPDDDYEETITDIRDCVDVTENGLLTSQKGTVFKSANVNVEGGGRTRQELNITTNGHYNTPEGVYYNPIVVNVPLSSVGVTMVKVQSGNLTTAGTPVTFDYTYPKSSDANYVVWIGKEQVNTRDLVAGQTYNYTTSGSGLTFDITLKKELRSDGGRYTVTAEFKDRGSVYAPLNCFLVVGELN